MPKVALITGGSMGLGAAVAERFRLDSYSVVTCARSGDVTYPTIDISKPSDVAWMLDQIETTHKPGGVDVLINNAAIYGPVAQVDDCKWAEWAETIAINLLGAVYCSRIVLPYMRYKNYGKIINVSGAGVRPKKETSAYNASKAGLLRFTEALAVDLEGTGIDVNSVAPGALDTRMRLRSAPPEDPELAMRQAVEMIAWLASDESDGITGRFFSAVWDDVGHLPIPLSKDDFRMRRQVPA